MTREEYEDEHGLDGDPHEGERQCESCREWFPEDDDCGVQYRAPEEGYRVEGDYCHECAQEMNES